ncbi:lysophospholipase, putative [Plasmodium vinckei vinckei]|uniref:Lysophospholipase, putative n=1 Tax=Plasmodium vinckei vinckei TaxID=54757 RepID=A0A449BNW1_PLAVN|nr:lysophospholipase, putative [Plasmodium vinckei vinckei]VEV55099.1 lysophospholipase, putative [Plasmodium vinckei vinckei]
MEKIELNNDESINTTCNLNGDPKIGWLRNKNGLLLKTYRWTVKNAIGNILLIHGFEAHTRANFMRKKLKMPNNNKGLVVGNNNYYIYKDSWIEKFNQTGYSVFGIDLQGHGGSQPLGKLRGTFNCFDDIVDDVIQYMNQIHDETSNDSQKDDESHNIVTTKKKKLPMYIIGYSMGANIALRILQLLKKEKEDRIKPRSSNNYKNSSTMLNNSTNINEIDNDMNNSNNYGSDNSRANISATTNSISNGNHEGHYNYLDKFNIKGCVSISGMVRVKSILDSENKSFWQYFLPIFIFMSYVLPHIEISSESRYKKSGFFGNICKHYIFPNISGTKFKWRSECVKATIKLDCDVNYIPKDIPLLFVHSKDDSICSYVGMILFYNKLNVNDKELHTVDGMNHGTTIKPGNEDILKKIIDWICNLRKNGEDKIENG